MDKKWNFKSLEELQQCVNTTLRYAMINERSKRWTKVIDSYKNMLWMIDKKNMPEDYEPPSEVSMLLYETYYHLGLAFQHRNEHKKASNYFTKALDVVSIPKGGCLAGCVTNSCLMTPLYARRAFAHAQAGNKEASMKDAEKAVVLDSRNPDVFTIRALAHSTRDDVKLALNDLDVALRLNPNHMCSLVLRASLTKPLANIHSAYLPVTFDPMDGREMPNKYRLKLQKLDPQAESYMDVNSFTHSCALEFYDKFLYTLSVPHTIIYVNLKPDKPSKKQIEQNYTSRPSTAASRPKSAPAHIYTEPFKCGAPTPSEYNKSTARRRHDYGEAVRKHMSRPKTASEFFAQLEKERKKKAEIEEMEFRRSVTAELRSTSTPSRSIQQSKTPTPVQPRILKKTKTAATKTNFLIETPTYYNIPAFQPMNIKDAPRMYYKPWNGDKLPASPVKRRTPAPAFY